MENNTIYIFLEFYLPGYKSGGPLRTVSSIVEACGKDFEFRIVTRDRDSGDVKPYSTISVDEWNEFNACEVFYASPKNLKIRNYYKCFRSLGDGLFYFNSFFNLRFTIIPMLYSILFKKKILLCPRGEFSVGAMSIKSKKKRLYLNIFKMLKIHRRIVWHATDEEEAKLIRSIFGGVSIKNAVDVSLPELANLPLPKRNELLKICFLSRISPMKNLLGALQSLNEVSSTVIFDVYGPSPRADDKMYLRECKALAAKLPSNIQVDFKGEVSHELVCKTLKGYDLFFLPTLGENFGHAILEALAAGLPILIGNSTPWKNLSSKGIGWDLDPYDTQGFSEIIDHVAGMASDDHQKLRSAALLFAKEYLESSDGVIQTREMFKSVAQEQ